MRLEFERVTPQGDEMDKENKNENGKGNGDNWVKPVVGGLGIIFLLVVLFALFDYGFSLGLCQFNGEPCPENFMNFGADETELYPGHVELQRTSTEGTFEYIVLQWVEYVWSIETRSENFDEMIKALGSNKLYEVIDGELVLRLNTGERLHDIAGENWKPLLDAMPASAIKIVQQRYTELLSGADGLFPLFYAGLLAALIYFVYKIQKDKARWLVVLPFIGAVFDYLENATHSTILRLAGEAGKITAIDQGLVTLAYIFSTIKIAFIAYSIIIVVRAITLSVFHLKKTSKSWEIDKYGTISIWASGITAVVLLILAALSILWMASINLEFQSETANCPEPGIWQRVFGNDFQAIECWKIQAEQAEGAESVSSYSSKAHVKVSESYLTKMSVESVFALIYPALIFSLIYLLTNIKSTKKEQSTQPQESSSKEEQSNQRQENSRFQVWLNKWIDDPGKLLLGMPWLAGGMDILENILQMDMFRALIITGNLDVFPAHLTPIVLVFHFLKYAFLLISLVTIGILLNDWLRKRNTKTKESKGNTKLEKSGESSISEDTWDYVSPHNKVGFINDVIEEAEFDYVNERRKAASKHTRDPMPALALPAGLEADKPNQRRPIGLTHSGGGIRSGSFNLGFQQGLSKYGILSWVDYLTSVSGGCFPASALTTLLSKEKLTLVEKLDILKETISKENREAAEIQNEIEELIELENNYRENSPDVDANRLKDRQKEIYEKYEQRLEKPFHFDTQWEKFPFNPEIKAFDTGEFSQDELAGEKVAQNYKKYKGVSHKLGLNTQLAYFRDRGNYLAPRVGWISRDTLRLFGAGLSRVFFTLVLFLSVLLGFASLHYLSTATLSPAIIDEFPATFEQTPAEEDTAEQADENLTLVLNVDEGETSLDIDYVTSPTPTPTVSPTETDSSESTPEVFQTIGMIIGNYPTHPDPIAEPASFPIPWGTYAVALVIGTLFSLIYWGRVGNFYWFNINRDAKLNGSGGSEKISAEVDKVRESISSFAFIAYSIFIVVGLALAIECWDPALGGQGLAAFYWVWFGLLFGSWTFYLFGFLKKSLESKDWAEGGIAPYEHFDRLFVRIYAGLFLGIGMLTVIFLRCHPIDEVAGGPNIFWIWIIPIYILGNMLGNKILGIFNLRRTVSGSTRG